MASQRGAATAPDVHGDFVEGALGAGDDLVGAQALEDFREFVQVAADNDVGFLVVVAGALGDEQSSLNDVRSNNNESSALHAGIQEGALLFGVIHDNRFPGTKEIINGQGILFDQHVRLRGLPEVIDQVAAQVARATTII